MTTLGRDRVGKRGRHKARAEIARGDGQQGAEAPLGGRPVVVRKAHETVGVLAHQCIEGVDPEPAGAEALGELARSGQVMALGERQEVQHQGVLALGPAFGGEVVSEWVVDDLPIVAEPVRHGDPGQGERLEWIWTPGLRRSVQEAHVREPILPVRQEIVGLVHQADGARLVGQAEDKGLAGSRGLADIVAACAEESRPSRIGPGTIFPRPSLRDPLV